MQIGCTRKLREFIDKDIAVLNKSEDSFFFWSASLVTFNGKKTIVMLNEATQCGFLLFGITKQELENLDELFLQGIHGMLKAEHLAPQVIHQYLSDCRDHITYTRTKNRSSVSKLNHFIRRVEYYTVDFISDQLFQTHVLFSLNYNIIKQNGDYILVKELLQQEFQLHYPNDFLLELPMVTLDVKLLGTDCFRRIQVPLYITLSNLHEIIQTVYSWRDVYLHEFSVEAGLSLDQSFPEYSFLAIKDEFDLIDTSRMELYISLSEVFPRYSSIRYIYDLGDCWEHQITFVGINSDSEFQKPRCILAVGAAPPEDSGGIYGYEELCRILKDPYDEEYEEARLWVSSIGWNAQEVDVQKMNEQLQYIIL